MAEPRREAGDGYDNREIVVNYIHYKLSQRGFAWDCTEAGVAAITNPDAPPPAAAALQPRDPAASSQLLLLHRALRQAGDEFSRRYQRDFAHMSEQLHVTPCTARAQFAAVADELFRDGVNWGRIVAFLEFGGVLCAESVNREMAPLVESIAAWMTEYVNTRLQPWIQEQGGWDAFVELYGSNMRPLFDLSWLSLKTVLSLAVVVACITLGAYLGHK